MTKRFRNRRKQWIDYFGIVSNKNGQIYSNIDSYSIRNQNSFDSIAESFFSGNLKEKLYQIYNPYLKECKGFKIPNFYILEKDDITYIIIGVFRYACPVLRALKVSTHELILKNMALFIENLNRMKVVDITKLAYSKKKIRELLNYFFLNFWFFSYHFLSLLFLIIFLIIDS